MYDQYYSPEEQAEWRAVEERAFAELGRDAHAAEWKVLSDRIEAALPFEPASDTALAFLAE